MTTLKEQIEADIDTFMDTEDGFAEEVTITGTFGPYTINAIFDEHVPVIYNFTGDVSNEISTLTVKTKYLINVKTRDTVRIGSVTYEFININPDGTGITVLHLNKTRQD